MKCRWTRGRAEEHHHRRSNVCLALHRNEDCDIPLHKNHQVDRGRWKSSYKACLQGKFHGQAKFQPAAFHLKLKIRPVSSKAKVEFNSEDSNCKL